MHIGSFIGEDSDFPQATEWIKAYIVMTDSSISKTLLDRELEEKNDITIKKIFGMNQRRFFQKIEQWLKLYLKTCRGKEP